MLHSSHGVAYINDTYKINFAGDVSQGTFSDLFFSFPVIHHVNEHIEILQDNRSSFNDFWKTKYSVSPGTLLSMIPELSDYYELVTGTQSRTHPIKISSDWDRVLAIGDGIKQPSKVSIEQSFPGYEIKNIHGKATLHIQNESLRNIRATLFSDAYGNLWYIDNPFFPLVLPEISVHFLLLNVFSNLTTVQGQIVAKRYQRFPFLPIKVKIQSILSPWITFH